MSDLRFKQTVSRGTFQLQRSKGSPGSLAFKEPYANTINEPFLRGTRTRAADKKMHTPRAFHVKQQQRSPMSTVRADKPHRVSNSVAFLFHVKLPRGNGGTLFHVEQWTALARSIAPTVLGS